MKSRPPCIASSAGSSERRGVLDYDAGPSTGEWNWHVLFLQQAHVLGHAPLGLIETVFDRMSHPTEAFQVGGVKREKIRLGGGLDYKRVAQLNHRSLLA